MECCQRTEADKKGGHLAKRVSDAQLILRESAQCSKSDEAAFQDITRHQYFNTVGLVNYIFFPVLTRFLFFSFSLFFFFSLLLQRSLLYLHSEHRVFF